MTERSDPAPETGPIPLPDDERPVAEAIRAGGGRLLMSPSDRVRQEERARRAMLLGVRLLYMVLLVTIALLPFVGSVTDEADVSFRDYWGSFLVTFLFGAAVLLLDAATPRKRLGSVLGVYLGIIAGLVGALAVGALVDLVFETWELRTNPWLAYKLLIKLGIGITLCYLTVSVVLATKDDFRLVIPYVEFTKQVRGVRPLLLDTSVLIDGRIEAFGATGFLDAPVIVPQFVVDELQMLADSGDRLKRARGRRGLDMVNAMRTSGAVDVTIDSSDPPGHAVDHKLLALAREQDMRVVTTDYNLNKVAKIQGVTVLNVNDLANTLRPQLLAGDPVRLEISKRGEAADQGVGYLPDGTMVVVERAAQHVGETIDAVVTNALQTSAGRMIFAVAKESGVERLAEAAVGQDRAVERPERKADPRSRRSPRR